MMDLNLKASLLFGMPPTDDPWLLLGVAAGRMNSTAIHNGLRRRLAQLEAHPHTDSDEIAKIRDYLLDIAKNLTETVAKEQQISSNSSIELTPLDQAIIAALISEGGWNKKSRSRLVSIAASYSITANGLIRILEAFAEAARSGSGPLSVKQRSKHAINRSWTSLPTKPSALSAIDSFVTNSAKRITPDLSSPSPVMTVQLAVIFGVLTLIVFILSLVVLLGDDAPTVPGEQSVEPPIQKVGDNTRPSRQNRLFEQYPTFAIDGIEQGMLSYADQVVDQISRLESLAASLRRTSEKVEAPEPTVLSDWTSSIEILGVGWTYVDSYILQSVKEQIIKVLIEAEAYPGFATELVRILKIPEIRLSSPLHIARASWSSGVLSALRCDQRLSGTVRSVVKQMQFPEIVTCDSRDARIQALGLISEKLLGSTEFDVRYLELWEVWILVANHIERTTADVKLQMDLVDAIVSSEIDLLRVSNTRKVLGRIVRETNWGSSVLARDTTCNMISSSSYNVNRLALLTSLFHYCGTNSWFTEASIVGQQSAFSDRMNISRQLKIDWPIDASNQISIWDVSLPIGIDTKLIKEWIRITNQVIAESMDAESKAVKLRLLNEAAVCIWKGRPDLAIGSIDRAESIELDLFNNSMQVLPKSDGKFSDAFSAAREIKKTRVETINELSNEDWTDLLKRDADRLVSIALKNIDPDVREAAIDQIINKFNNGKNVALSLVDIFPTARTKKPIVKLIANLTNVILPNEESRSWDVVARGALVQHALIVGRDDYWKLDEVATEYATSLLSEYTMLNPDFLPSSSQISPNLAFEMVVDTWRLSLPHEYVQNCQVEFKSSGLLQNFIKMQLEYLNLLKAEESKWRNISDQIEIEPFVPPEFYKKGSIVDQLLCVESSISTHWSKLLTDVLDEYNKRSNQ